MKDLTIGKEQKLILQFALPMLLGNIFQLLYNVVNSYVVGQYLGKEAFAAVSASFPLLFALISLVIGVATGFTIIISQYYGAKNIEKIKLAINTMNIFLFIASLILTVVGILISDKILRFMNLPLELLPQAESYFNIYLLGLIMFFGFNGISAVLRGLGDSKTPLYFLVISVIINLILDLIFVVGFKFGVESVALATIISQTIAYISLIIYLNKTHKIIQFSRFNLSFDREIFISSLKIGLPSGMQHTFVSLGMVAISGIVNLYGTSVIAAYGVAMRIASFASMPAMNFGAALSTFVGQNIGANKIERVKKGLIATLVMTSIISVIIMVIVLLFSKSLMGFFIADADVIREGSRYLIITSCFYVLLSAMFVISGVLRGAGDTIIPMFITLFSLWVIRIPIAYFFSKHFGVVGIWWSEPTSWFVGATLSFLYFKLGKWKTKTVIKHTIVEEEII
jgi:putative MATE family efflux protein